MTAWNDDIAFIHIPKTAGKACRAYLHDHLKDTHEADENYPQGHQGASFGHIALRDFEQYTGRAPDSFAKIFAVVRDPYDHQVSQYIFWRDEYARGLRHPARHHAAMHPDLSHWLLDPMSDWHVWDERPVRMNGRIVRKTVASGVEPPESGYGAFGGYYLYWLADESGEIPDNVTLIRFERLGEDFPMALKPFTGVARPMEEVNVGPRHNRNPVPYYSQMAVELVERKFAHAFAEGWYERWDKSVVG